MFLAVVLTCLACFILLCWMMWDEISKVVRWQHKQHDRISKLEAHDGEQDKMLISHDSRLDRQHSQLKMVKKDIRELGKDVGWGDEKARTQLLKAATKPPDDEPPEAA